MGRKVFISVLGTGLYGECQYAKDGFVSSKTPFVQVAMLEYLHVQEEWKSTDAALFLLTEKAIDTNWAKTIDSRLDFRTKEKIPYKGLEAFLEEMNLPFKSQEVPILDGNNEAEMWKIFRSLYSKIEDNDELYIDLTHSFRYLPMLVLVFGNYIKFLKKARIAHLSYGNYEARTGDIAPIIDLLPISALQDWTFAVANYLRNGDASNISDLALTTVTPILKQTKGQDEEAKALKNFIKSLRETVEERQFCRGIKIIQSESMRSLKKASLQLDSTIIEPLTPVFFKIKESLDVFDDKENAKNGFEAAKWCLENNLFQQAVTILYENLTTFICIEEEIDWTLEEERALVEIAFHITQKEIEHQEDEWILQKIDTKNRDIAKVRIRKILKNNYLKPLSNVFCNFGTLRNDINHSGMRKNPSSPSKMRKRMKDFIHEIEEIIQGKSSRKSELISPMLINLSNHPSASWSPQQLAAAKVYGEIVDLPFPAVDPEADEAEIAALGDEYLFKIKQLAQGKNVVVHLMGEMTLSFCLVRLLQDVGITCVASTSERMVEEEHNGKKEVYFLFKQFRAYV